VAGTTDEIVAELRELIERAAPDPREALPVRTCGPEEALDRVIPFSSLIVLGVVVAVEDRYGITVTRDVLERAAGDGATLRGLAGMVLELRSAGHAA